MKQIRIIQANNAHISLLSTVGTETFTEAFAHHNDPDDFKSYLENSFSENQVEKELNEKGSIFLLAYCNDEPAGYVRLRESVEGNEKFPGKKTIELHRIYSYQKFIGKGIGKALLTHCITFAKEKSYDVLWLGVWEHNHHAIGFYKHFKFEPFGSHIFMLGNDAQNDILMKLQIA